jgi:hypothetical protein
MGLSKTIPVALKKLSDAVRVRRYSLRTEKAYLMWLRLYLEAEREFSRSTLNADTTAHTSQISTACLSEPRTSGLAGMNSWATWPGWPVSTIARMIAG